MTNPVAMVIAILCLSVLGYEYSVGGLPKVVLLVACVGLLSVLITFFKAWKISKR